MDPEGSLRATTVVGRWKASLMVATVVVLVVLVGVVSRFRKMPKALLILNGKLRHLAHGPWSHGVQGVN